MKTRHYLTLSICLLLVLLLRDDVRAQTETQNPFRRTRGIARVGRASIGSEDFQSVVEDRAFNAKTLQQSPRRVRFDFFPDVSLLVDFDRVDQQGPYTLAWSGRIEGNPNSSASFVTSGNVVTGSVNRGDGKVFQVRTAEDGTQWSIEIDQTRFPNDETSGPVIEPLPDAGSGLASDSPAPLAVDDGSTIDVLVVYTAAARIEAGGTAAMQQLVQLGIAETNTAYSNSGVIQRVRLVSSQEISYAEGSSLSVDLGRIRSTTDGYMDDVPALRNTIGADLVSLWVNTSEATCGVGYLLANPTAPVSALAATGYSVSELDCATGFYTFGHEMGHNMGLAHAKDDLESNSRSPVGAYPFANGYKQTSGTGADRFRTIMSYNCSPSCGRIQHFSNPDVSYRSYLTGVDQNATDSAANALALNNTRTIVANFRSSVGTTPPPPPTNTDNSAPSLIITTQTQSVISSSITISGTASDSGRGNNGISSVTVNGVRASGDTATASATANWSRTITLSAATNVITVIARDNSSAQNSVSGTITVTLTTTASSATAATSHVFPQVADGRLGDGTSYRTTLMISNPSGTTGSTCTLQLRGLSIPGFSLNYTMSANGWVIARTPGTGNLQTGYATLSCTAPVEAQFLYSYYASDGTKAAEATVFSSPPASSVLIIADEREGGSLGIAIANDSGQSVTYSISVSGVAGSVPLTIPARTSIAKFLRELVPSVATNSMSVVSVSSSTGRASVVGLRFTGPAFTTIPASQTGSPGATAATYHVFPQFADGRFGDGSFYRTTRINVNPSATSTASCSTQLRGLTTDDRNSFAGNLAPLGSIISPTNGTQDFQAGYATMSCTSSVDAEAIYSYYNGNGVKLSETTVFSSPSGNVVQILSDSREGATTGLAIANDSDQSNTYTITVYNASGGVIGTSTQQLAARSSIAKFVSEFVSLPADHYGPVVVAGTGPVSILGLRFTGSIFTTIPATIRVR